MCPCGLQVHLISAHESADSFIVLSGLRVLFNQWLINRNMNTMLNESNLNAGLMQRTVDCSHGMREVMGLSRRPSLAFYPALAAICHRERKSPTRTQILKSKKIKEKHLDLIIDHIIILITQCILFKCLLRALGVIWQITDDKVHECHHENMPIQILPSLTPILYSKTEV